MGQSICFFRSAWLGETILPRPLQFRIKKLACLLTSAAESLASMLSLVATPLLDELLRREEETSLFSAAAQREATRGGRGETVAATAAGANASLSEAPRLLSAAASLATVVVASRGFSKGSLIRSFSVGGVPRGEGAGEAIAGQCRSRRKKKLGFSFAASEREKRELKKVGK